MNTALHSADQPRTRPSVPEDWPAIHARLARSRLSGVALRLALYLLAKAGMTDRRSWCLPVEALAADLGVSRNTISSGLRELQDTGWIRRSTSTHRGAPTRTTLVAALPAMNPADVEQAVGPTPAADRRATAIPARPHGAGYSSVSATCLSQIGVNQTGSVSIPPSSKPRSTSPDRREPDWVSLNSAVQQAPLGSQIGVNQVGSPPVPIHQIGVNQTDSPPESSTHSRRTAMPPEELHAMQQFFMSLSTTVSAALETARSLADPSALKIDPDWHLSDQQIRWLRNAIPKRESRSEQVPNSVPRVACAPEVIPPDLAETLLSALPMLAKSAGSESRAAELLDEIACMVMRGGLGRGDVIGGARAGLALVRAGRWQRPKMMSEAWRGAVLQAAASRPGMH